MVRLYSRVAMETETIYEMFRRGIWFEAFIEWNRSCRSPNCNSSRDFLSTSCLLKYFASATLNSGCFVPRKSSFAYVSWGYAASWWILIPEAGLCYRVNHGQRLEGGLPPASGPGLLSLAMVMVLNRPLHFLRQPASVSQIWGMLTQALAIGLPDPRDLRVGVGMCFATSE